MNGIDIAEMHHLIERLGILKGRAEALGEAADLAMSFGHVDLASRFRRQAMTDNAALKQALTDLTGTPILTEQV